MPLDNKVSWAKLRVGIMAIVALTIAGVLIYLLTGTQGLFKTKVELYVYTDDSLGIAAGAPVTLNGILIGKVKSAELSGETQPGRVIRITLQVDSEFLKQIPVNSNAVPAQPNLLGARYINITRGSSAETVKPGAEIRSGGTAALEDLFKQGDTTLAALQDTVKRVDDILDSVQAGHGTIGKLLVDETLYKRADGIAAEAQKLIATLNSNKGIGKLLNDDKLWDDFRSAVARIDDLMDGLQQGQGTLGKLIKDPAMYDDVRGAIGDLRKTITDLRTLLADVNAGKGDIGKLFKSEELHEEIKGTVARLDTLLDKINSGQGTVGQLINNPSLYESLDGTSRELTSLLKDFRANPKKFLTIKLVLF